MISQSIHSVSRVCATSRLLTCAASLVILFACSVATSERAQGSLEGDSKRNSPRPPGDATQRRRPPSATQSMRAPRSFELHIVTNTPGCRIFTDARFGGETDARG
ncbi:MAG: hypothetical protein QOE33_141, partial [Acidobacteriota bacterium]|nr:hypothetical protein [Acidobacteriota bacterium]